MHDFAQVLQTATKDFEFNREMRYYTGKLHVAIGDKAWLAAYDDGKLLTVDPSGTDPKDAAIWIKGTDEQWKDMTAEYPRPVLPVPAELLRQARSPAQQHPPALRLPAGAEPAHANLPPAQRRRSVSHGKV